MSRALARLRAATGDPLLVRAGRGMVPTPHATELRGRVRDLAQDAQAVLRPVAASLDLAELQRTFTIRANEAFVEVFAAHLVTPVTAVAPKVRLHFAPKPDKNVQALRERFVDLGTSEQIRFRGNQELPAADSHGGDHGFANVASALRRRSGASLAARLGAGNLS